MSVGVWYNASDGVSMATAQADIGHCLSRRIYAQKTMQNLEGILQSSSHVPWFLKDSGGHLIEEHGLELPRSEEDKIL